jgi:hypothetical protein
VPVHGYLFATAGTPVIEVLNLQEMAAAGIPNNKAVSTVTACVPDTRVQGVLACLADRSVLLRSLRREEECVAYAPAYTETEAIQIELDGLTRNTFRMS